MKHLHKLFMAGHLTVIALFFVCAMALIGLATMALWQGFVTNAGLDLRSRLNAVLDSIGMLTIALVALELSQTIFEEEVQRDVKVSGPTRVRRFLSRFLVVIVVALSIESLVAAFKLMDSDPTQLPYAATIGVIAALLLIAWGVFVRLNRSAEELEPEAMEQTKREDRKVDGSQ